MKATIRLLFVPRDLWMGIYWERKDSKYSLYLCLLPMIPIRIRWSVDIAPLLTVHSVHSPETTMAAPEFAECKGVPDYRDPPCSWCEGPDPHVLHNDRPFHRGCLQLWLDRQRHIERYNPCSQQPT